MMPWVTEPAVPSGLPIATTCWPSRTLLESAKLARGSEPSPIASTAMSPTVSVPLSEAVKWRPSRKRTWIVPPEAITWLLVTMNVVLP